MSAVAKDVGYDIVKKPIVIAGTVIVIGGIAYYFLSDTLLGDMFGLLYDGLYYTIYGLTETVNFLFDGDTWSSAGSFFKDDVGGVFTGAGESIGNAFKF